MTQPPGQSLRSLALGRDCRGDLEVKFNCEESHVRRSLPRRPAVTPAATRAQSAPRSRLMKNSSHVESIRIGLPHIRIDNGPGSVGTDVS